MKHKGFKIFSVTALAIFNLFTCFAATFAWFTAAKTNNASNMAVQIEANELKLDYELLKFDEDVKQVVEVKHFDLNQYDSIIKERNINTAMIIKATLSGNILNSKNNIDVGIKLSCTSTNSTDNYLSNIIHFKFKSLDIDSEDLSEIYYQAKTSLQNESARTFITTVKNTEINLTVSQADIVNKQVSIYGLIDYDELLVDNIIGNTQSFSLDDIPSFENDLQHITYSIHE